MPTFASTRCMSFLRDFFRVLELSDESADEVDASTTSEPESKRRRTEVASASGIVSTANSDVVPVDEENAEPESNRFADGRSGDERFHSALYFNKLIDCVSACGNLDNRLFLLMVPH